MKRAEVATALLPFTLLAACGGPEETQPAPSVSTSATPTGSATPELTDNCTLPAPSAHEGTHVSAYLPTWGTDKQFKQAAGLEGIDTIKLSFAKVAANGTVTMNFGSDAARKAIRTLSQRATTVEVAVGGYGANAEDRENILKGFDYGLNHPNEFADQVVTVTEETAEVADVEEEKVQVSLDMEYPDAEQATKFPTLLCSLGARGIKSVSIAVGTGEFGAPLKAVAGDIAKIGGTFDGMLYDLNGPTWDSEGNDPPHAGPITDINWSKPEVESWVAAAGKPGAFNACISTYGYEYIKATKSGDKFDVEATDEATGANGPLGYSDLNPKSFVHDPKTLTSDAQTKKGWTNMVTPEDAGKQMAVYRKVDKTIGAFFWSATNGLTQDYIDEVKTAK